MSIPRFWPILLAVSIFASLLFVPERFLVRFLSHSDIANVAAAASWDSDRFKNMLLQEGALADNQEFLPLYGSSTVSLWGKYHPSNFFTTSRGEPVPFLEGQVAITSINHLLNFSAVTGSLYHKKLVFMVDPNDFMIPKGMVDQRFGQVYNKLTGYSFIFNGDLDAATKQEEAGRLLQYTAVKEDRLLRTVLEGISKHDLWDQIKGDLAAPAAFLYKEVLEKQDIVKSFQIIDKIKSSVKQPIGPRQDWDDMLKQAEKEGKDQTSNNSYGIMNDFYTKNIVPGYTKRQNSWKAGDYLNSVEYGDFQGVLEILRKEKANPIFVIMPRKGDWSDYIGFTKEYRDPLYAKIKKQVNDSGFQMIDYSNYEYDKYFMRDAYHFGWTGWIHLDEDLLKYYKS